MDEPVESVLAEYEDRRRQEFALFRTLTRDQIREKSDQFLMSIGADVGRFLNMLIKHGKLRRILEIGTSYGHSTIFLAEAARAVGGRVVTCDLSAEKQDYARCMLERAGLSTFVEFKTGDAHQIIGHMVGELDFVLLDARTVNYITMFDRFYSKLAPCAFVAADNIIMPPSKEAAEYRQHVRAKTDLDSLLLPIEQGIELSRCTRSS